MFPTSAARRFGCAFLNAATLLGESAACQIVQRYNPGDLFLAREASSEIVNLAVALAQQSIAQRHGKLLVNGRRLGFGKKFLKPRIVADRIPDGIDLQTRNGND